jgi:hypothetical protein
MMQRLSVLAAALVLGAATLPAAQAAPDDTLGMAILGGLVSEDGAITRASGLVNVIHNSTGAYGLFFDRDIQACMFTMTSFSLTEATVRIASYGGDQVVVHVFKPSNNALTNAAFFVNVFCPT